MDFKVKHLPQQKRFEAYFDDKTAFVEYTLSNDIFDIIHTIVPKELEGQGIAGKIVKEAYSYAKERGYQLKGSCSYAHTWLKRHPM